MFGQSVISHHQPTKELRQYMSRSNGKLSHIKKCKREARSQYESAFSFYNQEIKEVRKADSALQDEINNLKRQKSILEKSLQEVFVEREKAIWENQSLEKILQQQQEQINIYHGQKEEREENGTLLRKENLLQLKERQVTAQVNINSLSSQASLSQQSKELENRIKKVATLNQAKIVVIQESQKRLERIEQSNLQIIQKINLIEDQIERNTLAIESHLTQQSQLTNRYGELKRTKTFIQTKIQDITAQLQDEKSVATEFIRVEKKLNQALQQIEVNMEAESTAIIKLRTQNATQKKEIITNKQCLAKLMLYLENLKGQNSKIEAYMERVLQQDYQIKLIIDRKHSIPKKYAKENKWRAQNTKQSEENKSMSSTLG